jgi:O-antigen ligase
LVELYRQSHHDLRRDRAHAAQIGLYLKWLSPLLIVLLLVVATLLGSVEALDRPTQAAGTWAELVAFGAAMLAGAIGGVLGLMFRFRDTRGRIRDLLSDKDVRWVQPLIGAAMALAVVLIMKSGLITIAGLTAAGGGLVPVAALGFVAGFSEPVFFGVMDRLARAASPGPSQGGKS